MVPDLFHTLLMVRRRRAVLSATLPSTSARQGQRPGLGLDEPEDSTGWALTDTRAAALDIAQDQARGLEALEQWKPDGLARA